MKTKREIKNSDLKKFQLKTFCICNNIPPFCLLAEEYKSWREKEIQTKNLLKTNNKKMKPLNANAYGSWFKKFIYIH